MGFSTPLIMKRRALTKIGFESLEVLIDLKLPSSSIFWRMLSRRKICTLWRYKTLKNLLFLQYNVLNKCLRHLAGSKLVPLLALKEDCMLLLFAACVLMAVTFQLPLHLLYPEQLAFLRNRDGWWDLSLYSS